jgi:hypothetical protein
MGKTMRYFTTGECETWLNGRQRQKPDVTPENQRLSLPYPKQVGRYRFLSRWIATSLTYQSDTLLWITQTGIWSSSENWHLYYKLRQNYGDQRLLDEAPGHLFLAHEAEDLASFLQLAMLNGWDGYVLTHMDYVNAFLSHDEYIDFYAQREDALAEVREVWDPQKKSE